MTNIKITTIKIWGFGFWTTNELGNSHTCTERVKNFSFDMKSYSGCLYPGFWTVWTWQQLWVHWARQNYFSGYENYFFPAVSVFWILDHKNFPTFNTRFCWTVWTWQQPCAFKLLFCLCEIKFFWEVFVFWILEYFQPTFGTNSGPVWTWQQPCVHWARVHKVVSGTPAPPLPLSVRNLI